MFISPAFKVVNILKSVIPLLPTDKAEDIEWCINQITGGEIYSAGKVNQQSLNNINLSTDTLLFIGFFSNLGKVKQIESDMVQLEEIQKKRENNFTRTMFKRRSMPEIEIDCDNINFDIFSLKNLLAKQSHVLHLMSNKIFTFWNLFNKMSVDSVKFSKFVGEVADGYRNNPYHNNLHAADVMQVSHIFLKVGKLAEIAKLEAIHIFSFLLAAMIHDFKHPGVTNSFIEANLDEIALVYNDRSALENFHISEAFRVAQKPHCDIFENLAKEEFRMIRHLLIQSVLGTDIVCHNSQLGMIQNKLQNQSVLANEKELVLEVFLHAADISHSLRPWDVHRKWSMLLQDEFFEQGDIEKQLGRDVFVLFDRERASIPNLQLGFINGVILPYFTPLLGLVPSLLDCISDIEKNRDNWADMIS